MRTTVEITDEQHEELARLAARRKVRGFSSLVQEALDQYLADQRDDELEDVLTLRGSLSQESAERLRRSIEEAWATWPATRA